MMIRPLFFGLFCCTALSSCDKAKDMAAKAKEAVAERIEKASSGSGGAAKVDGDLQALVDATDQGYVFRKDLPFPSHVKVTVRSERKFKGRLFQSALLGTGTDQIDGTFLFEREFERDGNSASVDLKKSGFTEALKEGEKASSSEQERMKILMPPAGLKMERKGDKWAPAGQGKGMDFAMASEVAGMDFGDVLATDGLLPRPLWFGKQRMKPGDAITVTGNHLEMLFPPGTTGSVELKLESIGAVSGHPCGVFQIHGDVNLPRSRYFEGNGGKEQYSIESGKLWLSLLYPLVLKEEFEGVFSAKSGEMKGSFQHSQGTVKVELEREWSASPAKAE